MAPPVPETRSQAHRLDQHDEQIAQIQADVAEIKSAIQVLEADRVENADFRKIMLGWVKQQEKCPVFDAGIESGVVPPSSKPSGGFHGGGEWSSNGRGDTEGSPKPQEGLPWAVKKIQLPEFYGFDPQGWIQKAKLYFDINGTPAHLRIRLAQLSMTGVAQHWFTIVTQVHTQLTWEHFQEELLQRFSGLEIQNPYEQLATITQSDSIHEYIDDFEYLLSLVPKLAESQALGYFVAGLRDEVKRWVRIHRPQTRLDAMYLAKDVEEMLNPSSGNISQSRFRYHHLGGFNDGLQNRVPNLQLSHTLGFPNIKQVDKGISPHSDALTQSVPRQPATTSTEISQILQRDRGVRSLSRTEWEERRKKGLCFRCGQQFGPAHKCPEGKLRVLLLGEDEYEANGGHLYRYEDLGSPEPSVQDVTGPASCAS